MLQVETDRSATRRLQNGSFAKIAPKREGVSEANPSTKHLAVSVFGSRGLIALIIAGLFTVFVGVAVAQEREQGDKVSDLAALPASGGLEVTASALDLAALPSIDSIRAQTDITVFLRSGVPTELRLAALRRAWTVDPAIRDFKELAENDWDFNDLDGIPGFAEFVPEVEVKTMLALMVGDSPRLAERLTRRSDEPRGPSFAANALRRMFNALYN
jgi:uncharacterized protein DUF3306